MLTIFSILRQVGCCIFSTFDFESKLFFVLRLKGFKLRKNSSFKYVPRYMESGGTDNPYKFDSKFSKYKNTSISGDIRGQWGAARKASRTKGNREINFRLIAIIAVLLLIVWWFFDFDLSLFTRF